MTMAVNADPGVVHKFKTGFNECAGEVSRYIGRMDGVEPGVKQRLVSHLASCVTGLQQISPFTIPGNSTGSQSSAASEDVNNNTASARLQALTGLQLIPSRLPSGELALLLPNSQHLPFFPSPLDNQVSTTTESPKSTITSNSVDRSHNSAFTAVRKERFISRSPLPSPTSTTASSYGDESCDQPYPSPSHLPEVTSTSEHPRTTSDFSFVNYSQKDQNSLGTQSLLQIAPQKYSNLNSDPQKQILKFGSTQTKAVHTPLTVITSNEMLREHPQRFIPTQSPPVIIKDALNFPIKKDQYPISFSSSFKRPYQDEDSDKLLIKTDLPPPLKIPKLFNQSQNQNTQPPERRSLFEIQNHAPSLSTESQNNQPLTERKSFFEIVNQPSTSTDNDSHDMWRPW